LKQKEGFMEFCLFNGLTNDDLISIIPYIQLNKFNIGDFIFRTGDIPDNFYCILKGKISIQMSVYKHHKMKINRYPNLGEFPSYITSYNYLKIVDVPLINIENQYEKMNENNKFELSRMSLNKICILT